MYPDHVKHFGRFSTRRVVTVWRMASERHDRLREARVAAGFERQRDVFARHPSWNRNSYKSNENGNAPFSFEQAKVYARAFGVSAEWLYDGTAKGAGAGLVPIVGYVGADAEGQIHYASGQDTGDRAPIPPAGTERAVALEVRGHSMKGFADDGALIYFEEQHAEPTREMFRQVVAVQTRDGRVLIKRLLPGSRPGHFDLESIAGPLLENVELEWAALVTAIVPPAQARRIIVRSGTSEAA